MLAWKTRTVHARKQKKDGDAGFDTRAELSCASFVFLFLLLMILLWRAQIMASKTVVWNGPAGVFEFDNFSKGTKSVLDSVAALTKVRIASHARVSESVTSHQRILCLPRISNPSVTRHYAA